MRKLKAYISRRKSKQESTGRNRNQTQPAATEITITTDKNHPISSIAGLTDRDIEEQLSAEAQSEAHLIAEQSRLTQEQDDLHASKNDLRILSYDEHANLSHSPQAQSEADRPVSSGSGTGYGHSRPHGAIIVSSGEQSSEKLVPSRGSSTRLPSLPGLERSGIRPDVVSKPRSDAQGQDNLVLIPTIDAPNPFLQDLTTVLPTADDIEAELILAYNGGGAHMIPTSQRFQRFNWIEPSTYSQLAERVVSWGKSIANHLPTGHEFEKVYLWHGVLRILSDDNLTRKIKQLPLAEDHSSDKSMANSKSRMTTFTEETTFGIFQFVLANPYRRFRLQYSLTYSSVLTKRSAGQTRRFEELIRQEVTRLKAKNVNFNNQQFISRPDVDALTSKDVIRQILLEKPDHLLSAEFYKYPETTATRIIEAKASKLFLACIINYRPNFEALTEWQNFQERKKLKYDDGNLPTQVDQLLNEGDLGNLHALHAFFAVNIHDGIDRDVTYEACEVLPVLYVSHDDKNVSLGEGSSGKVSKVRIDPGHHDLSGDPVREFALKEFYGKLEFQREYEMLQTLRALPPGPHPHIVTHLASWQQKGSNKSCILYPLAQGNLRTHFERETAPEHSVESTKWLLQQLVGLMDAINKVHGSNVDIPEHITLQANARWSHADFSLRNPAPTPPKKHVGWHHDLKPENILVFKSSNPQFPMLKISDFGAGKFHSDGGKLSEKGSGMHGTASYFGPEEEGKRSRPFDIWAMACIFTEILIWFLGDLLPAETPISKGRAQAPPQRVPALGGTPPSNKQTPLLRFHYSRLQQSRTEGFSNDKYWYIQGESIDDISIESVLSQSNESSPRLAHASLARKSKKNPQKCLKPTVLRHLNYCEEAIQGSILAGDDNAKWLELLQGLPGLIKKAFHIDPSQRPKAENLLVELRNMVAIAEVAGNSVEVLTRTPSAVSLGSHDRIREETS